MNCHRISIVATSEVIEFLGGLPRHEAELVRMALGEIDDGGRLRNNNIWNYGVVASLHSGSAYEIRAQNVILGCFWQNWRRELVLVHAFKGEDWDKSNLEALKWKCMKYSK